MSDTTDVWFIIIDHKKIPIGHADEITVPKTISVTGLRKRIKEREHDLAHVDADQLNIFQCTDPSIDLSCDDDDAGDEGKLENKLEKVFSNKTFKSLGGRQTIASLQLDPQMDVLIVQVDCGLHTTFFCSVLKFFSITDIQQKLRKRDDDDVGEPPEIKRLSEQVLSKAPSYIAAVKRFSLAAGPDQAIDCNRPFSLDMLPIELYHEAFGKFRTRCDQPPSHKALTFLDDLAHAVCHWNMTETSRRDAVQEVFKNHVNLSFDPKPIKDTTYMTDGHLDDTIMPAAIRACKNESGDALNKAAAYYGHFVGRVMDSPGLYRNQNTRFPCILMVDQGESTHLSSIQIQLITVVQAPFSDSMGPSGMGRSGLRLS
jgi:hypothetical protein